MTPDEIRARVAHINSLRDDDEAAHAAEDDLYTDVLHVIAGNPLCAAELAHEALKTKDISFNRWCA